MNVFETALSLLDNIASANTYLENIKERYALKLATLFECIICGNSPYTKHLATVLHEKYNCKISIVDIEPDHTIKPVSFLQTAPKDATYILASTVYLGYYSRLLLDRGIKRMIPYHALPLLDVDFDFSRKAYSAVFFRTGMESIVKNSIVYKNLLLSMSDSESVEIMAKFICYRLTADYHYACVPAHKDVYFGHEFLSVSDHEVVIDGGGFDADTLEAYLKHYKNFDEYWLFEPEAALLEKAKARFTAKNIHFSNLGLYDKATTLSFLSNGQGMGRIAASGDLCIQTAKLDDLVDSNVSFMKLDVEGVELAALAGAAKHIRTHKPKLAISVYHNPEDMLTLSTYIRELVPKYRFYLRCGYDSLYNDLVLFAVV
ncbi:FkbM family methyltransferase [Lachnospiraceae bacterium ZAX-1]